MAYQSPTLSQLIKQAEQHIQHRLPTVRRNNVLSVLARIEAGLSAGEHMHLDWLAQQIIPTTADEAYLLEHCAYRGIARKAATAAEGIIVVEAVSNSEIPKDTVFKHTLSGLHFIATATTAVRIGTNEIHVRCESEGTQGNVEAESTVNLTSAILGVKPNAKVKALSGGTDIESLSSLLGRLIYRVQYPPAGGSTYDYVRWAKEVSGVTRAWCFPRWQGGGTVGVAFVMDNQATILPTAQQIDSVKRHISGHKNPITNLWEGMPANVELFVFAPAVNRLNLTIRLVPNTLVLQQKIITALATLFASVELGGKVYLSHLRATISNVIGETDNSVLMPTADVQLANNQIVMLGNITWQA